MSKTITVSDEFFAELQRIAGVTQPQQPPSTGGGGSTTPQPPQPPVTPPAGNVTIINLPWTHTSGLPSARIPAGGVLAFRFTVPASGVKPGVAGRFSCMPTGGSDYVNRILSISDSPGDFSGKLGAGSVVVGMAATVYFTVGGRAMVGILNPQPDMRTPDLVAGATYYGNVKNEDPSVTASVNYSLYPPN